MKELITQIIIDYLPVILASIGTFLVARLSKLWTKIAEDKTKRDIAATTVRYIEQVFIDLHGKEKLQKAKESMSELLISKGINITEVEITMLLEEAVKNMNYSSIQDFIDEIKNG